MDITFSVFKNTFLLAVLSIFSCSSKSTVVDNPIQSNNAGFAIYQQPNIIEAAHRIQEYLPLLKGKKVGLVANQSSVVFKGGQSVHLVDTLMKHQVNIQKVFAPEHGFRGTADAGELIKDGKDSKTGLPIVSLYGNNKKPKPEQLQGIDVMLFDLQDVGVRFYTYISTLHYVMEACAEQNIPLIVLDRPNPNGFMVDGPMLEKEYTSFVGMHPIPVLHGMTIGEYAQMINGEKWLKNQVQCSLTVISCLNYTHQNSYSLRIKPSPNLPNDQSINLYPSLCFFEGTNVSVGRGTEKQFQIYGSPFLKGFYFQFTPKPNVGAKDPMHNGKICFGEDLSRIALVQKLELKWLIKAYQQTEDKTQFFNNFFVKLAGTQNLQKQIESGLTESEIRQSWQQGLEDFKLIRAKYLLYE